MIHHSYIVNGTNTAVIQGSIHTWHLRAHYGTIKQFQIYASTKWHIWNLSNIQHDSTSSRDSSPSPWAMSAFELWQFAGPDSILTSGREEEGGVGWDGGILMPPCGDSLLHLADLVPLVSRRDSRPRRRCLIRRAGESDQRKKVLLSSRLNQLFPGDLTSADSRYRGFARRTKNAYRNSWR